MVTQLSILIQSPTYILRRLQCPVGWTVARLNVDYVRGLRYRNFPTVNTRKSSIRFSWLPQSCMPLLQRWSRAWCQWQRLVDNRGISLNSSTPFENTFVRTGAAADVFGFKSQIHFNISNCGNTSEWENFMLEQIYIHMYSCNGVISEIRRVWILFKQLQTTYMTADISQDCLFIWMSVLALCTISNESLKQLAIDTRRV